MESLASSFVYFHISVFQQSDDRIRLSIFSPINEIRDKGEHVMIIRTVFIFNKTVANKNAHFYLCICFSVKNYIRKGFFKGIYFFFRPIGNILNAATGRNCESLFFPILIPNLYKPYSL